MESILLVDDEAVFNFISTKVLEGLGVSNDIHTASSGPEALNLIDRYWSGTQTLPRLIIVDLDMPQMDGFAFIEALHQLPTERREKTLLAILTSSKSKRDMDRAQSLGIKHFLIKPLSETELKDLLQEAEIL